MRCVEVQQEHQRARLNDRTQHAESCWFPFVHPTTRERLPSRTCAPFHFAIFHTITPGLRASSATT